MLGPISRFKDILVGGHQRSQLIRGGAASNWWLNGGWGFRGVGDKCWEELYLVSIPCLISENCVLIIVRYGWPTANYDVFVSGQLEFESGCRFWVRWFYYLLVTGICKVSSGLGIWSLIKNVNWVIKCVQMRWDIELYDQVTKLRRDEPYIWNVNWRWPCMHCDAVLIPVHRYY